MENIFLASDHAGLKLKGSVKAFLKSRGHSFEDLGSYELNKEDDYPDYVIPCARKVAKTKNSKGIVFGFSGQGEAMAANKIRGIRASVYYGGKKGKKSNEIIKLSREHNDSNILSLGAGFVSEKEAINAVRLWLDTKFSKAERHERRNKKVNTLGGK